MDVPVKPTADRPIFVPRKRPQGLQQAYQSVSLANVGNRGDTRVSMQKLRLILSLLLCLAVPTAGWASIANDSLSNRNAVFSAQNLPSSDHGAANQAETDPHCTSHGHHAHGAAGSGHDEPGDSHCCKACTSSAMALSPLGVLSVCGGADVVCIEVPRHIALAPRASALRPPISLS